MQPLGPSIRHSLLFTILTVDIRNLVWGYLDGRSFARLGAICKHLRQIVNNSNAVWREIYIRDHAGFCPEFITDWKKEYVRNALIKRNFRCKNMEPHIIGRMPAFIAVSDDRLFRTEWFKGEDHERLSCFDQETLARVKRIDVPGADKSGPEDVITITQGAGEEFFETNISEILTLWHGDKIVHSQFYKGYTKFSYEFDTSLYGIYFIYTKKDYTHCLVYACDNKGPFFELATKTAHQPLFIFERQLVLFSVIDKSLVFYHIETKELTFQVLLPKSFQLKEPFEGITFEFRGKQHSCFTDTSLKTWVYDLKERTGFHRLKKCRPPYRAKINYIWGKLKNSKDDLSLYRWNLNTLQMDKKYTIGNPVTRFHINGNRILVNSQKTVSVFDTDTGANLHNFHYAKALKSVHLLSGIIYAECQGRTDFWDIGDGTKLGTLSSSQLAQIRDGHIVGFMQGGRDSYTFYYNLVKSLPKKSIGDALKIHKKLYHAAEKYLIEHQGNH